MLLLVLLLNFLLQFLHIFWLFFKRPFIFELRDLWPESIKAVGAMKDNFLLKCLERLEIYLYRQATELYLLPIL